ncbi:MAG: VCBS repeat-containing protein, partial [archaeon]|nr:VCBS repeat-containing protein [archaeon]
QPKNRSPHLLVQIYQDFQLSRSFETGYTYDFGISLGDLNEDGRLEIIAHDSTHFYVFNLDGSPWPNFPVSINDIDPNYPHSYLTSIGVADLDGDTFPDLYGEALYNNGTVNEGDFMYSIYAINRLGQSLQGFPFRLINYEGFPPGLYYSFQELYLPTFADINKDRIADIVASKGWGRIEAFTLNHPYNKSSAIFPQYGVDEQNTKFVKLPS